MFITIDPYYPISFYNECKEALKNNGISFQEFISIKAPFDWYLKIDEKPIMVNYDELKKQQERFLVSKVKPLTPNEEYLLIRRSDDEGQKGMLKYVENEPLKQARMSEYAVFFNADSKEQLMRITRESGIKVWYFGKYFNNRFKVALCTNKMILNFISPEDILIEKNGQEMKEPGRFESELNFKVFRQQDYLKKYTETAYFADGKYFPVKIKGDRKSAVSMDL